MTFRSIVTPALGRALHGAARVRVVRWRLRGIKIMVKTSLEEYRQRAAGGSPEAIFDLAWEYFRERKSAEDLQTAIATLRRLEEKHPEWAHFNIAKMKYFVGDASLKEDIRSDCDAG